MNVKTFRSILWVGAAYDLMLGVLGLLAGPLLYRLLQITPPNHWAYIHLIAGFVLCLGVLQILIARSAKIQRDLVFIALLMKVVYSVTVFGHWIFASIPYPWVIFAYCDTAFAIVFILSLIKGERRHVL
jgi:hypothetical protein